MGKLSSNCVLITGALGLIGRSFAEAILREDGKCLLTDLDEVNGQIYLQDLQQKFGKERVFYKSMDITSSDDIDNVITYFKHKKITIDSLVNCAYPRSSDFGNDFFDVEYETLCQNMNLHIGGYFLTSKKFSEYFKKQGRGNIINLASIYGSITPKFEIYKGTKMTVGPEYAIIKSAIIHLTKFMAKRLKGLNIRVNSISPGGIFDNQPEPFLSNYRDNCSNKGMLNKEDLDGTLIFLLSEQSKFIQGQLITVDDGFSL